jgi:hypothetical protein
VATRWCLNCGGEYIDAVDECPDCELPLVDERPDQDLSGIGDGQVAYDLADWAADLVNELQSLLDKSDVAYEFDEDGDIVTLAEHEDRVESLIDSIEFPDGEVMVPRAEPVGAAATGDDDDDNDDNDDDEGDAGIDAAAVLSDLFVSTDGVLTFVDAADRADRLGLPYGFSRIVWKDILNQVTNLRALLEDDDSNDDDIENDARDLRNTLRDYV